MMHWINNKDSNEKDHAEKDHTLTSFELEKKNLIFMPVCKKTNNDMVGGEHWTLLVYKKDENTWYHFDSIGTYNDAVARNLVDGVNKYLSKNNKPNFVRVKCTQQNNGCDCGPYVGLFAKKLLKTLKIGNP